MSLWRRVALEKIPELRRDIEAATGLYDFCIYLRTKLNRLYTPLYSGKVEDNEPLIAAIYDYARWCWRQSGSADITTAIFVCFYEHLPTDLPLRKDVGRWLSHDEFEWLLSVFAYHLDEEDLQRFISQFAEQKAACVKDKWKAKRKQKATKDEL